MISYIMQVFTLYQIVRDFWSVILLSKFIFRSNMINDEYDLVLRRN